MKRRDREVPRAPRVPLRRDPRGAQANHSESASGLGFFIAALATLALAFHAKSYLPFIADDALISLRYAERLLGGHGLTWNDGERVEGYSNLLWVLLCSGLGALGIDLVVAARMLGLACGAAALAAVAWSFAPAGLSTALPALAGTLVLALAAPVAVWTIGGLETPLVAALLAWAITTALRLLRPEAISRDALVPSLLLGLLCITRPDGFVLAGALCAGLLAARGVGGLRMAGALAVGPALFTLVQLGFRLAYYGEWISNSSRVKLALSAVRLRSGAIYLIDGLVGFVPLALGIVAAILVARGVQGRPGRMKFLVMPLVAWALYLVVVGGDVFPARRLFVPLVVVTGFMGAEALGRVLERRRLAGVAGATLFVLAVYAALQLADPAAARSRVERWEWDGEVIGRFLARAFGDRMPMIAVDPAGSVPYWSKLPAIDMLGLSDRWLAHHPPADFGSGRIGHELGNGRYVLSREPDLVLLCVPTGRDTGCFRSGKELVSDSTFTSRYALVTFEADEPYRVQSRIWTRRDGGKLGIVREPDRVTVPGWLLSANPASVVRLDAAGRPGVLTTPEVPAVLVDVLLPPGSWQLAVESDRRGVRAEVRDAERGTPLAAGSDSLAFDHAGGPVDVGLAPADAVPAHVRALVFRRTGSP